MEENKYLVITREEIERFFENNCRDLMDQYGYYIGHKEFLDKLFVEFDGQCRR